MGFMSVMAVSVVGAFGGPMLLYAANVPAEGVSAPVSEPSASTPRWSDVRLAAELRSKDTAKIDVITAGEEQKSSFDQCSAAEDVALCRILVSAVNVAAIIGTSIPGN
jgi:hypothetical protein